MKKFLKNMLSSCLGSMLAFLFVCAAITAFISYYTTKNKPNQKGVLHITIEGTIQDYSTTSFDISQLNFTQSPTTLWALKKKLYAASSDDNINGILLDFKSAVLSQEMASEIALLLEEFRMSGKKIFAYSYYYDQNAYLLSTFSDSIFLNPNGGVDLKGYALYSPFFKGLLDKLDIDINIYYAGKYKSSIEPYKYDSFTADNEFQYMEYLEDLRDVLTTTISKNRGISEDDVSNIIRAHKVYDAKYMMTSGIVDRLLYDDELKDILEEEFGESKLVPFANYQIKTPKTKNAETAIVFAEGEINWGGQQFGAITYDGMASIIKSIKENDEINKVILRINSPGGNGYTSELIHREIKLLRKNGKKVYASLGPYATSGGYYIASACDSIFALPNTMTGSIGVYIMLPTVNEFLENQLFVTSDSIKTDEGAISYTPLLGLDRQQNQEFIDQTDDLYELFITRVAEGRQISKDSVQAIAQGRIWSGKAGQRIGLVDDIKGFLELITMVSGKEAPIKVYPEQNISLRDQIWKTGLEKFAISSNDEIKFIKNKVIEIQKIVNEPVPNMKIPSHIFVTNR